jgi:NadR type nicotinamide-nucleotide adenylyltransferase
MKTGVILMTALVPTIGHDFLVKFARNFLTDSAHLFVIISTRSKEPTLFSERISSEMLKCRTIIVNHSDEDAPQNPEGPNDFKFWEYWRDKVHSLVGQKIDYVFASEKYGHDLAEWLDAEFIPVDIARDVVRAKGLIVRRNLSEKFDLVSPAVQMKMHKNIVLFGPESCGKTTMAKHLAATFKSQFLPEWARPYLEEVGPETTEKRMRTIVNGQFALEQCIDKTKLFTFLDTDLLTTLGFYRLYNMKPPIDLFEKIKLTRVAKTYIVMNDEIPFTADILRYGGDHRESKKQFWIDILNEFDRHYYVVEETDPVKQGNELWTLMRNLPLLPGGATMNTLHKFERE